MTITLTGFKENNVDLSQKYISAEDVGNVCNYLNDEGLYKYNYGSSLWLWGFCPASGAAGNYDLISKVMSSPTQIGTNANWKYITGSSDISGGIRYDGTLWVWGYGLYGELGDLNTISRSSPIQVGTATDLYRAISAGQADASASFFIAIKLDNTLWGWGCDSYGNLGQNSRFIHRSSPTQIGSSTWNAIATGERKTVAIETSGKMWSWGENNFGSLGLNISVHTSSPIQIGSLTDWTSVKIMPGTDFVIAKRATGGLYSWGKNSHGQLGLGNTTNRSNPVQIGSDLTWFSFAPGGAHVIATKTNGSLWAWGSNTNGVLGTGDTIHRSTPIQIGSLLDWSNTYAGTYVSIGIKSDSFWIWGGGYNGLLGTIDNASMAVSSPIQLGGVYNDWDSVGEAGVTVASNGKSSAERVFAIRFINSC